MSIIAVIFTLLVIGIVLYLINRIIPMDGNIKLVINCLVLILVIAWLLKQFGLLNF